MKPIKWLYALPALILSLGVSMSAKADWVPVNEPIEISQEAPVQTGEYVEVAVAVWNKSADIDIEGKLRLRVISESEVFPAPSNALTAGEDGSNPVPYFELSTLQEGYFEAGELAYVDMLYSIDSLKAFLGVDALSSTHISSLTSYYSLQVEVNDASIVGDIFRKKISKGTPEFYSGEALLKVMEVYVKAQNTKGQSYIRDTAGDLMVCCEDGVVSDECLDCSSRGEEEFAMIKPLVVTYIQAEETVPYNNVPCYGVNGEGLRHAHDVYAAVSLDEGLTWKRKNISRTSTKSSFNVETCNGEIAYPGDSESQDLVVGGHYAMVTWVDKFCRSGNPWGMADADDIYHVMGSQRSVDYLDVKGDEDPRPDLGERPFSCLWAARGVLELDPASPDYGTIVWYKPEQLSVGRRDAIHNFSAVAEPLYDSSANQIAGTGGFAVSWQEDPMGLKTGHGRGPGAGMSGSSVNHKTDIWYSHIHWEDFAAIDPDYDPTGGGDESDPTQTGDSDGNTEYHCPTCSYVYDSNEKDVPFAELPEEWVCPLDGTPKSEFVKDSRPQALYTMSPPVPVTNNAVCRERETEPVYGHLHIPGVDCDYFYEGGTNNQPLLWEELPADWVCPKCGHDKSSFSDDLTLIKYRHEGGPYCQRFAENPRVDQDGNYATPFTDSYAVAFYTQDGEWQDAYGTLKGTYPGAATIEDGVATIDGERVYWSGEPLDGNTGASRANLALVNFNGSTLALVAYEETKGVGIGSDKTSSAMEQKAPYPLVRMEDGRWEAGATNSDCRSCHYQNIVPRDRYIPVDNEAACLSKGGIWKGSLVEAYYPYTGYPYLTEDPLDDLPDGVTPVIPGQVPETTRSVPCVKYEGGKKMFPRDWQRTDAAAYYDLPDRMPGWHQEALDCNSCHLPFNTKDLDKDGVMDRADLCLETPVDEVQFVDSYGCSLSQDPNAPDNNKDEVDRYRHGKNIYYHSFAFAQPETIAHGDQINLPNEYGWSAQGDIYENARRVRVVVNEAYDPNGADVTLGLLYKEGKDGQGAPADAVLRLFRNGFGAENMDPPLNLSSSTPAWFRDPAEINEDAVPDNRAGDGSTDLLGGHKTPHVEHHYWTDDNLNDPSGFWLENESGDKEFEVEYTPKLRGNPFENVFSTRLAIRGNTIVSGFAHCGNWSAGKKAKDHYDFYIRVSKDSGKTWTLPVNVSRLKNHKESVSDCRVMLTPETIEQQYPAESGSPADISMNGAAEIYEAGDFHNPNTLFVGIGTKENIPQPNPSEEETDENEIFLDVFYSRATIEGTTGGENGDLVLVFDTYSKENPLYIEGSAPYLNRYGTETWDEYEDEEKLIPHQPNPAYPEYVDEFDWMAKGDAHQGDVQLSSNPYGTKLLTIWEQELPLVEENGQTHFQGSDVWFRKVSYPDPEASSTGDVDGDGDTDWDDGILLQRSIGTTAYDPDFLWAGDYNSDFRITGHDYSRWKVQFAKNLLNKKQIQWRSN